MASFTYNDFRVVLKGQGSNISDARQKSNVGCKTCPNPSPSLWANRLLTLGIRSAQQRAKRR